MLNFKEYLKEVKEPTGKLKDACWTGYTAVGMKMKNGKKVPNCVPQNEEVIAEGDHDPYYDAQENKKSAESARKQGDYFAYHMHMADHHSNMAHWSSNRGRYHVADQHQMKADEHHDYAMQHKAGLRKEETELDEAAVDAKGYKSSTGGLTQKGRDAYNRKEGSNLQAPVTTPPSKLKAGSKAANRRKSFCARMSGVEGPMKKPNGEPTRKALALRKWNC